MRASLLCLAIIGCTGPRYPKGISGARLAPDERANVDARVAATAECLHALGYRDLAPVERIRVEPTCWIDVPGYSRPQRGTVDHGAVRVGRCTRALQHEATVIMLRGYHSHAPDSPTILCEHAGPKPFACSCEEKS